MSETTQGTGPPDVQQRNALVEQLLPVIPAIYAWLRKAGKLKHLDADEALSYGGEALIGVVERWLANDHNGATLATYARRRVFGALLDAEAAMTPDAIRFSELEHSGMAIEGLAVDGGHAPAEQDEDARDLLRRLPEPERQAVQLVVLDGLSYPEAGAKAGVSRERIRQRLQAGLKRLRVHLGGTTEVSPTRKAA